MAQAKLKGLSAVRTYLSTESAKICGYRIIDGLPQATYNKLMKGDIRSFRELENSKANESLIIEALAISYAIIYQVVTNPNSKNDIFIINSIFVQE